MYKSPRLILAGLRGGSGKTLVSLGLCRHWKQAGYSIKPFKKGPDYIDAAWMALAAQESATNLDPFLMDQNQVLGLFAEKSRGHDISVIEGNRGLFDGKDTSGTCSTAELSRLLKAPVVLVIDCTKMTRTVAAVVQGCHSFEPDIQLAGVIFNRTAGDRHRSILTRSVEKYTDVPVIGSLPKSRKNPIPERHMGLISDQEHDRDQALGEVAGLITGWLNTDIMLDIARGAGSLCEAPALNWPAAQEVSSPRIGYVRDAALWFYYEENLEALQRAGAELVEISLLRNDPWPELHGLYLGGGFPETQAQALAANSPRKNLVVRLAEQGLPMYAECGGLMYLGDSIVCEGREYSMTGIFPFRTDLCAKPQGHGYTRAKVVSGNPFHPRNMVFTGHEFHYSRLSSHSGKPTFVLKMLRGHGIEEKFDGLVYKNVFATYTHLHSLGVPSWAQYFVKSADTYRKHRRASSTPCPSIIAE